MATLIFYIDDGREIAVPVDGRVKVGSAEGNDVMVADAGVCPRHAEISLTTGGSYHIRDLGSENGTKVNGQRVDSRDLQHGDDVSFGRLCGKFYIHEAGDAPTSEEQAKQKLRELKNAYNDTYSKHATLLGVVTSLATQERQKLASLDRLQTDTLNLETRIANARGILHQLEESTAQAFGTPNTAGTEPTIAQSKAEDQNILTGHLQETIASLENDKLELERSLWNLAEKRKESEARREQADLDTSRIRAEHQKLSDEASIFAKKQIQAEATLLEHETRLANYKKSLIDLAARETAEADKTGQLSRERLRLEHDVAAFKTEERAAREAILSLEKQKAGLSQALHEREEKLAHADRALAEVLEKHRQISAEYEAFRAEKEHHDIEISRLSIDLRNVRTAVADMESRHAAGLELLRVRQDQVRSANENLDTAKAAHQAGIHSQEQALKAMLERLRAAEVSLQECIAKNEALTRDNVRLQSALAQVAVAEEKQANLAAQNRQLEEQASRLNSNLAQRHDEMDSVIAQLTSLRVDESALLCVIQTLRQNEQTEQQRFDHARKTHAQIDQQAAAKHAELESALEYLRGQISKLEAYLTSLEVWRDDMNEHYTRLATMPEDSAEALKLWREIHRKKEGIAAQLPSQTGIKPRFNTQVQVVPRGQRLS